MTRETAGNLLYDCIGVMGTFPYLPTYICRLLQCLGAPGLPFAVSPRNPSSGAPTEMKIYLRIGQVFICRLRSHARIEEKERKIRIIRRRIKCPQLFEK